MASWVSIILVPFLACQSLLLYSMGLVWNLLYLENTKGKLEVDVKFGNMRYTSHMSFSWFETYHPYGEIRTQYCM